MLLEVWQLEGMVFVWTPKARFYRLPFNNVFKMVGLYRSIFGFPLEVKLKLQCSKDTLFVFADQALGLWVPLVKNRKAYYSLP
jgi:hypothetical protein